MSDASTSAPLRRLAATESPIPGALLAGDPPLVWTDADLWEHIPAWRAEPDGHLLAPVDAGRTSQAHGLLIPHCPHRLAEMLERRVTLADGEVVTIAVSLLRGGAEADRLGAEHGRWWVTSDGRPVLATVGVTPWRDEAQALFELIGTGRPPALGAALDEASQVLSDPRRLQRELAHVEDALFATAEAAPLATELVALRARTIAVTRGSDAVVPAAPASRGVGPGVLRSLIERHFDARVAERVQAAWSVARTSLRAPGRRPVRTSDAASRARRPLPRRLPLLLGCGAGAIVLCAGLLWPDPAVEGAAEAVPASAPPRGTPAATAASRDLRDVGAALIDRLATCAADGCGSDVVEDVGRDLPAGATTDPDADRTVSLLDEYGGVAVLRVESADARAQIAVLVSVDEKWLVRDVYDVADQP